MKHLRVFTKQKPAPAYWWQWYIQLVTGIVPGSQTFDNPAGFGFITGFVNTLFALLGGADIRDV